ncbi:hypothetical protein FG386_002633 [Cryptosporidium ryanae]|uniref:uncharacterized protein n=1 Tax=Cryptosporidium ryanae TaxID=515981 RepID=UPI00351A5D57|nr:hypothetical protein FG386_002633 [Cryptosporidium ryanae]
MKLLKKVAGSRFLNRQPIVESDPNLYAIRDQKSKIYKSAKNSSNIGVLKIKIDRAIVSPMGFNRDVRNFIMRDKAEWVLEITVQGQMLTSKPVSTKDFILEIPAYSPIVLSPKRSLGNSEAVCFEDNEKFIKVSGFEKQMCSGEGNKNPTTDLFDKNKLNGINNNTGAREVLFSFNESFQVNDLYSDLNIDLICRVPIECKHIQNRNSEYIVDDFYCSKNQNFDQGYGKLVHSMERDFEEEYSSIDNDNLNDGDNEANTLNNNTSNSIHNSTINQSAKKDSSTSFSSSYKQYKVIRIEHLKPNCKLVFDEQDFDPQARNIDVKYQEHKWEVIYDYMHFGKVTIPISNIVYNKVRSLPSFNNEHFELFISKLYNGYFGKLFSLKTKDDHRNDGNSPNKIMKKSNSADEWALLYEKKDSVDAEKVNYDIKKQNDLNKYTSILRTDKEAIKYGCKLNSENPLGYSQIKSEFETNWYHLYPKTSDTTKYVKPVPGITEFGLSNPIKTLGFIQISLIFETESKSKANLLLNTFHNLVTERPITRWILPVAFEPQYFQRYAESLKLLLEHYPRWVPKFCFLLNFRIPRSRLDKLMILIFWLFVFHSALKTESFFTFSLTSFFILPLIVSLTYKFGSQIASRVHLDYLTRIGLLDIEKRNQMYNVQKKYSKKNKGMSLLNPTSNNIFRVLQPLFTSKYYSSMITSESKSTKEISEHAECNETKEEVHDQHERDFFREKNIIKEVDGYIPKEVYFGTSIISKDHTLQYDLLNGDGYICISRSSNDASDNSINKMNGNKNLTFFGNPNTMELTKYIDIETRKGKDYFKDCLFDKDVTSDNNSLKKDCSNYLDQSGVVETPFGELRIGIRNQYDDKFVSIFFDDQNLEPIQSQISNLIMIVQLVQQSFANISTLIMKLKYSLNFEDPIIPLLTIVVMAIIVINLNLCWYLTKIMFKNNKISVLFRSYLFINFVYWLMHKDPYNFIQFEILNKRNRININNSRSKWLKRFFKMIHIEDRNLFILLKSIRIYDYYPEKYVYRQVCTSKNNNGYNEVKYITLENCGELSMRNEIIPIQILPLTVDEYLFFYAVKYIFLMILILGSVLRFFQQIFFSRITLVYKRMFLFWWYAIPDIREIEHRCITSTQLIGSLDNLLIEGDNVIQYRILNKSNYEISNSGSSFNSKNNSKEGGIENSKADLFLKQFYFGKNSNINRNSSLTNNFTLDNNTSNETKRQDLISRKSLIEYILPVNAKDNDLNSNKNEKNTSSRYDVIENLLEGFYIPHRRKKIVEGKSLQNQETSQ